MQLRRDKGLCYFCDDKFSHTHRCPNRRLMTLQLSDGEEETLDPDAEDTPNSTDGDEIHTICR
jgi:hypothetical protein